MKLNSVNLYDIENRITVEFNKIDRETLKNAFNILTKYV